MLSKKAMILFDEKQYQRLKEEAVLRKTSVGSLVREAVQRFILHEKEDSQDIRIEAARRLVSAHEDVPEWEEIERTLGEARLTW